MRYLIFIVLIGTSFDSFSKANCKPESTNRAAKYDNRPECTKIIEDDIGKGTKVIRIYFIDYKEENKYRAPFISEIRLFDESKKKLAVSSVSSSTGDNRRNAVLKSKGEWYPDQGDNSPWIELNLDKESNVKFIEYIQNLNAYCLIDCTPKPKGSSLVRGTPNKVRVETSKGANEYKVDGSSIVTIVLTKSMGKSGNE